MGKVLRFPARKLPANSPPNRESELPFSYIRDHKKRRQAAMQEVKLRYQLRQIEYQQKRLLKATQGFKARMIFLLLAFVFVMLISLL